MRLHLLSLLTISPFLSFSQFAKISYVYDTPIGNVINGGHGLQLGLGSKSLSFSNSPITFSSRANFTFIKPQITSQLDGIEFEMPDDENKMGYGEITLKRFSLGLDFDLGYRSHELTSIEPFVAIGSRISSINSFLSYDLYLDNTTPCACIDNSPHVFTKTKMLGYVAGLGVKFTPSESFYFDVRANYIGQWLLNSPNNHELPDPNSFYIDPYGQGRFQRNQNTYLGSLQLEVGIIFKLQFDNVDTSWYSPFTDSNDDSSPDSCTPTEGGTQNQNTRQCTPQVLSPAGRGGGK